MRRLSGPQPLDTVVLDGSVRGGGGRIDEGDKRGDEGDLVCIVPIERFDTGRVVQAGRLQTRLLRELTQGGGDRRFTRLDRAMHRLPRPGTAPVRAATQDQHLESLAAFAEDVRIDERNPGTGHGCEKRR